MRRRKDAMIDSAVKVEECIEYIHPQDSQLLRQGMLLRPPVMDRTIRLGCRNSPTQHECRDIRAMTPVFSTEAPCVSDMSTSTPTLWLSYPNGARLVVLTHLPRGISANQNLSWIALSAIPRIRPHLTINQFSRPPGSRVCEMETPSGCPCLLHVNVGHGLRFTIALSCPHRGYGNFAWPVHEPRHPQWKWPWIIGAISRSTNFSFQ